MQHTGRALLAAARGSAALGHLLELLMRGYNAQAGIRVGMPMDAKKASIVSMPRSAVARASLPASMPITLTAKRTKRSRQ